jgi:hypothetical protein
MQQCIKILLFHIQAVPDNIHHLHIQQHFTYEKPEAASEDLGS